VTWSPLAVILVAEHTDYSSALSNAALELAEQGWRVFPCHEAGPKAKAPYTARGFKDASTDPDQIAAWWRRWPAAMIGAPVPDSLLVLDLDPRHNGSVEALEQATGPLPATLTAWSGRGDGGRHLYFRRPVGGTFTAGALPDGVDLKAAGGYCILPPSLHPATGRAYVWEHRPPVRLPTRAAALLRPPPRPACRPLRRVSGDGGALVAFVARFTDHGVNNALYWAAGTAAASGLLDAIRDELIATAVAVGESERQARRTIDSAAQSRRATGGVA
jgi:hypothetical protein